MGTRICASAETGGYVVGGSCTAYAYHPSCACTCSMSDSFPCFLSLMKSKLRDKADKCRLILLIVRQSANSPEHTPSGHVLGSHRKVSVDKYVCTCIGAEDFYSIVRTNTQRFSQTDCMINFKQSAASKAAACVHCFREKPKGHQMRFCQTCQAYGDPHHIATALELPLHAPILQKILSGSAKLLRS